MSDLTRVMKWIAGLALGAALAAASSSAWAQMWSPGDSWKGMDRLESADPRFERKNTLKVLRSNGDVDDTLTDQGSVLGFGSAAATGTVEPRVKPGTTESLEVMKKGELAPKQK